VPHPPAEPKIYHIAHVDRLASIVADGCLWSDAVIVAGQHAGTTIGMGGIKARRISLPVTCHAGDHVGDYVPFYFCPRSIMLYVIHRANHPELTYQGGQTPIVHLEADLHAVAAWANHHGRRWAFSLSNAGANYTEFRLQLGELDQVNWPAVTARDFRAAEIKEGKQAEFLVRDSFPWHLVQRIGVLTPTVAQQVADTIRHAAHRPVVEIRPDWYF
jgi:hypothetical protein